jgi:hypothetical protein
MRHRLVDALRGVAIRHGSANWTNPDRAAYHRSLLARCLDNGRAEYPERFDYPGFDLASYLADLSEVRELVEAEAPEHFRSSLVADLTRMEVRARSLSEGDASYAHAAPQLDGLPDASVQERARAVFALPVCVADTDEACIGAEVIAARMRAALDTYGLDEWTVELHECMAAKASVNGARKRLRIRQGVVLSGRSVDRLVIHEIGGHVLPWANAENQPEPLAGLSMGPSTLTDEGLALWEETRVGLRDPAMDRLYAARAVAVDAARTHGIVGVAALIEPRCRFASSNRNSPSG